MRDAVARETVPASSKNEKEDTMQLILYSFALPQ